MGEKIMRMKVDLILVGIALIIFLGLYFSNMDKIKKLESELAREKESAAWAYDKLNEITKDQSILISDTLLSRPNIPDPFNNYFKEDRNHWCERLELFLEKEGLMDEFNAKAESGGK